MQVTPTTICTSMHIRPNKLLSEPRSQTIILRHRESSKVGKCYVSDQYGKFRSQNIGSYGLGSRNDREEMMKSILREHLL